MVKKTIPQLSESTTVPDNSFFVMDNGSVTKKVSKINLQRSFVPGVRHISLTSLVLSGDDATVIFDTPDLPAGMDVYLPPVADFAGKVLRLKNNGTGLLGINVTGVGVKIDGQDTLDLSGLYKAVTLVCDGSNWFIFS